MLKYLRLIIINDYHPFLLFVSQVAETRDFLKYIVPEELEKGVTYEFDLNSRSLIRLEAENCTKPGKICDGCAKVYECIQIGNGFIIMALDDCPQGTTCLQASGSCTTNHNPDCDEDIVGYRFVCRQPGLFPDAFNCQLYHMCVPGADAVDPVSIPLKCEKEFYYDSRTTLCRKPFVGGDCPDPVPACKSSGEVGVLASNPALYYICAREGSSTSNYPQIFACASNQEYSVAQRACVDPTPTAAAGADGKCKAAGTFYDPANCFSSYVCAGAGDDPEPQACEPKMHFDSVTKKCIDFTCNDVDK